MKANLRRRAGLLMLPAVAATPSSCKKNSEIEPQGDLADRIAGQYTFSSLTLGGKVYPAAESNIKAHGARLFLLFYPQPGSRTVNSVPSPSTLSTVISPPWPLVTMS